MWSRVFFQASLGTFDAALRFSRLGDQLTVLHVMTGDAAVEAAAKAFWSAEASKVKSTSSLDVLVSCVPHTGKDVVDTILGHLTGCQVLVMGSLQMVTVRGKIVLGSVAQAVAKRAAAHVCIVKNFSAI